MLAVCLGVMVVSPSPARANGYDMPLLADDLTFDERVFKRALGSSQVHSFGYDFTVYEWVEDDVWTDLNVDPEEHAADPQNSHYRVFGTPFYAMKSGEVIACWRSAPDNPRPKVDGAAASTWRHPKLDEGRLPVNGNMIWIAHDDGSLALYAHAQADSISLTLCPKTKPVFDSAYKSANAKEGWRIAPEARLNKADRRRVEPGQYLGRVGNSGESTQPHLHVHVQQSSQSAKPKAVSLEFARGLYLPWDDRSAGLDNWSSIAGQPLPDREVLIWAPRRRGAQFVRHKSPEAEYDRLAQHLTESGLSPRQIDGYSVGLQLYYNHIWEPVDRPWRVHLRQSKEEFVATLERAREGGFLPLYLDSYWASGKIVYAVILVKDNEAKWRVTINQTARRYQQAQKLAKSQGLTLKATSIISDAGERRHTALYHLEPAPNWHTELRILEEDFQKSVLDKRAKGFVPIQINGYAHRGVNYISAIFAEEPISTVRVRNGLSPQKFGFESQTATSSGMIAKALTAIDGTQSRHRYSGVWVKAEEEATRDAAAQLP